MNINLNLKSKDLLEKVLDKHFPKWYERKDDYYLTELSVLLLQVYNCPYTQETLINNLRISRVDNYKNELQKVLDTPNEAIKWILNNRMSEDRLKANQTRYLGAKNGKRKRYKRYKKSDIKSL